MTAAARNSKPESGRLWRLRELGGESAVYGLGSVVARGLSLILVPFYTRIFEPRDYGIMGLVGAAISFAAVIAPLGSDSGALRLYRDSPPGGERKTALSTWAWFEFGSSAAIAAFLWIFSGPVARLLLGDEAAGLYVALAAAALPLGVFGRVLISYYRMERKPWPATFQSLGRTLGGILATLALVLLLGRGLRGVYEAGILAGLFGMATACFILGDSIRPAFFSKARLREMMAFGLPLLPASFSFWIVNLSDRFFLQAFTNTSEVGLYQVGTAIASVALLGSRAFQQAFTPFFLSIYKDAGSRVVFADVFLAYAWGSCVLSAGLSLFAPEAIRLLATHEYAGAASVVGVLALAAMGAGLRYIAAVGLSAEKANWPITAATLGGAVASAGLNLALVPTFGRIGAAVSALLTHLLVCAYLFREGQKRYRVPYRYGPALACLTLALCVMAAGAAWPADRLWSGILVKAGLLALFLPALLLFKIMSPLQVRSLLRRAKAGGGA